jgi:hypothetical protein
LRENPNKDTPPIAFINNHCQMKRPCLPLQHKIAAIASIFFFLITNILPAQTPSFPGADGFGRFAKGARGAATRQVYIVTNLNDAGPGSFRDAVSQPGRIVVFAVGGIIRLATDVLVSPYVTIAGQTAPGDGVVLVNKRVTFTGANHTICRYLRIRLGATNNSGKDASGLANGANIMLDHMSFSWGMDEVFSINWDGKNTAPDSITVQNSIIAQGLHRENHSAGGLIQTPDGGKVSLLRNLYISNKTRNPKVKGINEFVNNVVYDWGNGNRLGDNLNYGWSGEAYIMGGSSGISEVNIINNYFMAGPLTPPSESTPFSRGTGTFYLYGAGNYFDNNRNGIIDGALVPYNDTGYPGIIADGFKTSPFAYPQASPVMTAEQAYQYIIDNAGASYPRRDAVDGLLIGEVASRGTQGYYVYRETDLPFSNGGVGEVFNAPAPPDTDADGMPDAWEDANGLNKNLASDAIAFSTAFPEYLNIEVYVNSLINTPAPDFTRPPGAIVLNASSFETPAPYSKVAITWADNSSNEDHFVIERSEDGISYTLIANTAANTSAYTDSIGLVPNKTYYYRLKAVALNDSSAYSLPVSIKTPQIPAAPASAATPAPANGFQYAELSAGKLLLKWTGSSNTQNFEVYFGPSPSSLNKIADVPYVANPSYQLSGLVDFTTYYWRIDASNNKGTTEGETWSFRTTKIFPLGMVGHWSFDETEGRQVTDSSSYEDHGVLGLDDDDQSIRVAGKVNNGIDFATANTSMYVVSIPHKDHLYLDKGPFSLSFWMKANPSLLPPDNNTSSYLLCKGSITRNAITGATGKRFDIEFKNKQLRFAIDDDNDAGGGGKDELQTDGTPFFNGDWVHVVAIRDTATKKLLIYRNGAFVKDQAVTKANAGIGEASALIVGNIGELEFLSTTNQPAAYKGMLDELKVFNYALTPAQVLELFHTSPLPLPPYDPSPIHESALEGYTGNITLRWKGGLKTTQYKLYLGSDASNLPFVSDISLNDPSYLLTQLTAGTTYYWRVDALGPAGISTGPVWSFTAVSPRGLVGHWKLDETSGIIAADNSNYHHNGTLVGLPEATWSPAKFGNGLQYKNPTSTGTINVPHASHLMFDRNAFTISLWIKLTRGASNYNSAAPAKDCYLIHKGQFTDPGGKWYGIQLKDSVLTFAIDDASVKSNIDVSLKRATAFNIFNDEWTNIVAIKDTATKQIKLLINGVQAGVKTYTTNGTIGKALPLLIGNSAENKPFHDIMDDVRLYNYALSTAEIASLINGIPLVQKATDPKPADGTSNVGYGTIDLSWRGKAQTYNLYFGTDANAMALTASELTDTSYQLTGISVLQPYYWRVDAVRDGETAIGDTWSFTVTDTVPPTVITKDIEVYLDENGTTTIQPFDIDNGSTDDYGIALLQLNKSHFDCTSVGLNTVGLTATDNNGNAATGLATVIVKDTTKPTAITRNISVTLVNGIATITAADVNNGSGDACGIKSMSLDKASFTCSDIGSAQVVLTVTDMHDNTASATATVTVIGSIPRPSITVTRSNHIYTGGPANTIYLGYGAQQLNFLAKDSGSTGSTFVWTPGTSLNNTAIPNPVFSPTLAGNYSFTATATNSYGCSATASVAAEVIDVRCGHNLDKVKSCFYGVEFCLPPVAMPVLLRLGFKLGDCMESSRGALYTTKEMPEVPLKFMAYPNPASDKLTLLFSLRKAGSYQLAMYNAQGVLVRAIERGQAAGITTVEWNISGYPTGVYFVKLVSETGVDVKQVIIQR